MTAPEVGPADRAVEAGAVAWIEAQTDRLRARERDEPGEWMVAVGGAIRLFRRCPRPDGADPQWCPLTALVDGAEDPAAVERDWWIERMTARLSADAAVLRAVVDAADDAPGRSARVRVALMRALRCGPFSTFSPSGQKADS